MDFLFGHRFNIYICESGTHLSNTKEAEAFALVSEEGIAKGVRRVTALTMGAAKEAIHQSTLFSAQIDEAGKLQGPALEKVGCYCSLLPELLNIVWSLLISFCTVAVFGIVASMCLPFEQYFCIGM